MVNLLLTGLTSLVLAWVLGYLLVPLLAKRGGKSVEREELEEANQAKVGTPTMGGLILIGAAVIAALAWTKLSPEALLITGALVGFGLIGFVDDLLRGRGGKHLGLKARYKLVLQLVLGALLSWVAWRLWPEQSTLLLVSVSGGQIALDWLALPLGIFLYVGFSNAVNLTDGLDGLASSTVAITALAGAAIAFTQGLDAWVIPLVAIAGACIGFLWFNAFPARIFMGDTGSLALGGALAAAFFSTGNTLLLIPAGLVFVLETLSVILQVGYFKATKGKRIFRMAPLHHHFRLGGWSEIQTVVRFGIWQLLGAGLALLLILAGAK